MRIGILGGSFDPVHLGHIGVARAAADALALERVWLMPAAQAPLRDCGPRATIEHRLEMLRLTIEAAAAHGETRLEVCEHELRRGGTSYTADTLRFLHRDFPEHNWVWLIGGDQLARLGAWRDPDALVRLAEWAVYARPGHEEVETPPLPGLRVGRLPADTLWPHSSTEIRARVARGETLTGMVVDKVIEYIAQNRLYATV